MVATVSPELHHLDETVSTCRFAQRVSKIKNQPKVNEEVENQLVIEQLRTELDKIKLVDCMSCYFIAGDGKLQPVGQMRPSESKFATRKLPFDQKCTFSKP